MRLDPERPAASSPYVYCANNPLKFTDPTGRAYAMQYSRGFANEAWSERHANFMESWGLTHVDFGGSGSMRSLISRNPGYLAQGAGSIVLDENGRGFNYYDPEIGQWQYYDNSGSFKELFRAFIGLVGFAWSLPNTCLGVLFGIFSFDIPTIQNGVIVFESTKGYAHELSKIASAQTFGHVIISCGKIDKRTLNHELTHVRQNDLFGPTFLPAYGGAAVINQVFHIWNNPEIGRTTSRFWTYWSNPFEIPAFRSERRR